MDSLVELMSAGRNSRRQQWLVPKLAFGQIDEEQRVFLRNPAVMQDQVIAGDLALEFQPATNPTHCRLKKEDSPDELLSQIEPVVAPVNMRQLVSEDRLRAL